MQTFTVPYAGYYKIALWGAKGGDEQSSLSCGYGGYVSGDIKLSKNNILQVYVGRGIADFNSDRNATFFNSGTATANGRPGGGSTDIRTVSGEWNNANSVRSRIIVAAGGGINYDPTKSLTDTTQGNAGGLTGYSASDGGTGGTQTTIGITQGAYGNPSFGVAYGGCSGGNGWYPGGGATCVYGSGGGSSYISGHTGSVGVTSTSSSSPKSGCTTGTTNNACSITPYINPATNAGYTFTNTVMIDGAGYKWTNTKGALTAMPNPSGGNYASGVGHSGNGYARITWLGDTI